jgi:hypothetical protein
MGGIDVLTSIKSIYLQFQKNKVFSGLTNDIEAQFIDTRSKIFMEAGAKAYLLKKGSKNLVNYTIKKHQWRFKF